MKIELQNICKSYGVTHVLEEISLSVEHHELFFLLGPSGCGKTTLLRIIAGFIAPDSGNLLFDGKKVNELLPQERHAPMVFQNYALWPHLNTFENVAYGLRVRGLPESEIRRRSLEVLEITRMTGYEHRFPNQLSGGQQQRVAIARALAIDPAILLFDEPLSNLDAKLRIEMREEILDIHRRKPFTVIYVTHDQEEAMTMATRIAVLEKGILHQTGSPQEIYRKSKNRFVAEFLGPMNWLTGIVQDFRNHHWVVNTPLGNLIVPPSQEKIALNEKILIGFRPSAGSLDHVAGSLEVKCKILQTQYTGALQRLWVKPLRLAGGHQELRFQITELNPRHLRKAGEILEMNLAPEDLMVLPFEPL